MIRICLILLLLASNVSIQRTPKRGFNFNLQQNDYSLIPEHIDVVHYNKDYIKVLKIRTFKHNRTTTAFNFTLNFKYNVTKLEMLVQAYKLASNEYRVFPMRVQFDVCQAISHNFTGSAMSSCGNFRKCPLLKGVNYTVCNWVPDESKLPPYFPTGRYMVANQFFYESTVIALTRVYGAVTRPEV